MYSSYFVNYNPGWHCEEETLPAGARWPVDLQETQEPRGANSTTMAEDERGWSLEGSEETERLAALPPGVHGVGTGGLGSRGGYGENS